MAFKKLGNESLPLYLDEATGALLVGGDVLADLQAAAGVFASRVSQGRTALAAGAMAITLHASTPCTYFRFWLDDGASTVHYKADGAAATATTDLPQFASQGPRLIKLDTPATSITLWGSATGGNVNWEAGN